MGKSRRAPIMAAGGIVIRNGPRPLVAVVQRRRDDAWVLPKGKLKPNEKPIAAAKREATEETGSEVRVHEFLGVIYYVGGHGPKIAHFWRMQALDGPPGRLMGDIKAVDWLPLAAAVDRLDLPHEQSFLRNVGREVLRKSAAKAKRSARPAPLPALESPPPAVTPATEPTVAEPTAVEPPPIEPTPVGLRPRWIGLSQFAKRLQEALGRSD